MEVMLIGGTRFIGPAVVQALRDDGHSVTLFNRGRTAEEAPAGVRLLTGDRRDPGCDPVALRSAKPDAVIDMCCITAADARWLADVFGGHCPRLVLVSSCDVYRNYGRLIGTEPGEPDPVPLTEDSPLRDKRYPYRGEEPRAGDDPRRILDDYDKIPAEELVLGLPDGGGVVTRLPMVYGPRDYQHRLYPYISRMTPDNDVISLPPAQAAWLDCRGFVGDIGRGIALAATNPAAGGRAYNIAETGADRLLDWVREIAAALGWAGEVRDDGEPDPEDTTDYRAHLAVDSSRIRSELGYAEALPVAGRIRVTAEWERANPPGD